MPVLEATGQITPKSALRHRPIGESPLLPGGRRGNTALAPPITQRASRPRPALPPVRGDRHDGDLETEEPVVEWKRKTTQTWAPSGSTCSSAPAQALPEIPLPKLTKNSALRQVHPLVPLGMIAMLLLWTVLSMAIGWLTTTIDDLHYGRPRTYQTDAWVGHNEQTGVPSHFIAINLHRHIEVIEIPGGDAAYTRILSGPQLYGATDDLAPVTVQFADLNGDHKPDMIVRFSGSRLVFINDGASFRPLQPSEREPVEQALQLLQP